MRKKCARVRAADQRHLRILAALFSCCVIVTAYPKAPLTLSASAEEKMPLVGIQKPGLSVSENTEEREYDGEPEEPTGSGNDNDGVEAGSKAENGGSAGEQEAMWQTAAGGAWQRGTLADAVDGVYLGGTVVLRSDVSLTDGISVSKQVWITSYDADNPYTIKNSAADTDDKKNTGRIFTVNGSGSLLRLSGIILDGGREEGTVAYHPLICVNCSGGGVVLGPGAILQNAENKSQSICGGGINIRKGQVLMYDGSQIVNCMARHGGGIEVNSSGVHSAAMLGMAGGRIAGCEADDGGGVYVNIGMFQMQGGEITGCHSIGESEKHGGGGICLTGGESERQIAAVLIAGGRIVGNKARVNGGGILLDGRYASCQMNAGTVVGDNAGEGNRAKCGGGICVLHGNLKLYGGTVTGNDAARYGGGILGCPSGLIELQGNPEVYGNTAGELSDRFDNLYLDGNEEDGTDVTLPIALTGPLTNGVRLGLSRLVCPDEDTHPCRDMIVSAQDLQQSSGTYKLTEADADRLAQTREEENKQLYADNMEKYAFVQHEGKIVMILAPCVVLDRDKITFTKTVETTSLIATVLPENALIKDVIWKSSDETVAKVDGQGNVTATGEGKAVITVTTVSPYHAAASCEVTVTMQYHVITQEEHGKIIYQPGGPLTEGQTVRLTFEPDEGYQLKENTLKVFKTGEESTEVTLNGKEFVMPGYDVTVTAAFEPVVYPIAYELDGGSLPDGEGNPAQYTIESAAITLKNPEKKGYRFKGWTGTDLKEETETVTIPAGSTGARVYTAAFEPIVYPIAYELDGGSLPDGEGNPAQYTIESAAITLKNPEKKGYRFKGWTGTDLKEETETVTIPAGSTGARVYTAAFEPIVYPIAYELDGGSLPDGEGNPAQYTIESVAITLKNPGKKGYRFKGWTGTDLKEETETVTIPAGSTGARAYTAVWERMPDEKPKPGDDGNGGGDNGGDGNRGGDNGGGGGNDAGQFDGNMTYVSINPQSTAAPHYADNGRLNPQTGNDMLIWYMLAAASVIGLLLLGVFAYAAMKILAYRRDLKENAQELALVCAAAGIADTPEGDFAASGMEEAGENPGFGKETELMDAGKIDFAALQARNKDIRGWLACSGIPVNNPVVQERDNAYYLRHSFMKKENRAGCLFMDYRNESFEDRNVVIYGHNTTGRTMFGSLKDVLEDSFWEKKGAGRIDLIDTDNCLRTYQIFSFYVVENEDYYISTSFESGEAYEAFLRTITDRSRRDCGVTLTEEDHILTLSTCYGRVGTERRLAVHAKEVKTQILLFQ